MSPLLVPDRDPPWRPAPAFVIEHPRAGLLVFDCGLSRAVAEHGEDALPAPMRWFFQSRGKTGRTLDVQMREAGLEPRAVRFTILSHLHEDHTGVAAAFPHSTFAGGEGTDTVSFGDFQPAGASCDGTKPRLSFHHLTARWTCLATSLSY